MSERSVLFNDDEPEPLYVDLARDDDPRHGDLCETSIYARALRDGKSGSYDIVTLHRDSLFRWLRSRGGANPWAENVVAVLLGHKL
jgi:hypothetical protein